MRHVRTREPLGEDNPERLRRDDRRRRRLRRAAAATTEDRDPDDDEHDEERAERDQPPDEDLPARHLPGRGPRLRRHYAGAPLDHVRKDERRCAAARASSSESEGVCCARSVVKRSSKRTTGTSSVLRRRLANSSLARACSPRSPRSVRGRPTTTLPTSSRATRSRTSASPASLWARSTTPIGRAIVPVGSETATPVRAEP